VPPHHESYFCQVWHHRLGDAQAADQLVYARPDAPDVVFEVDVTSDGAELIITSRRGASNKAEVHIVDLNRPGWNATPVADPPRALVAGFTDGWHFIDGAGGHLYFLTDHGAPLGRIVSFALTADPIGLREIVAESADKISQAKVAGGRLVVSLLRNASDRLRSFDLDGGDARDIALPGIGSVAGIEARWSDPQVYVGFTSFTTPLVVLAGDASGCRLGETMTTPLPVDPAQYDVTQAWYSSKDGTRVSMFLVHRADAAFPAPVILTGYGGFNVSLTPAFDASDFLWLDAGGVIAVANLRGGGEYGETWHEAGMRDRKQNVFDDFVSAAEWLLASGRASRGQIVIEGASNGGLLIGAVLVQRPDLFGAVVCRVPVADMLRYHLFTVGRFWIPEYGCADDPDEFTWLVRYSPYHNVRDAVAYPPTLVMTADTDDRVDPGMAKKFAARLQEVVAGSGGGPILLRVEPRAGHGAGKPVTKQIDEQADIYEFLFQYLTRTAASEDERLSHGLP
jgi:prolyl oligopeptidase